VNAIGGSGSHLASWLVFWTEIFWTRYSGHCFAHLNMNVDMCWKFGHIYFCVRGKPIIVNVSDVEIVGQPAVLVTWPGNLAGQSVTQSVICLVQSSWPVLLSGWLVAGCCECHLMFWQSLG
jgi:hypothetical protein